MSINVAFISGLMFGIEFFSDPFDGFNIILDLGIIRILGVFD